ncbi:Methyltransferase domain-containing protein [Lutibacter agarilyticus]|uniref:Methyltransferase domain-containing protein n=1 Tax=Lutibacter agarilyticus TaxID=1109740 RepID=A0A238YY31_9FLAO|nr:methyltransferase domain-containing protein [Lutibacter agarilyticus]SNR75970.1 Methyltransferase domain-containing protein [Lutibacter agarilyticus]
MKLNYYIRRVDFAEAMMDKYLKKLPNKVISDIGSGWGNMKNSIVSRGFEWQPFDYIRKIEEAQIWDLNESAPTSSKKAGGVIFLEVLEHLANPLLGLTNIYKSMEKGGVLILTTPNPQSSKNTLNLFLKGTLYTFQEKHLLEHHVFTPWEHIVRFYLENLGFEIKEYAIVDIQYKSIQPKSFKERVKRQIENYIEKRNPKALGMSYGIVAVKK